MVESLQRWWLDAGVDTHYSDQPAALLDKQSGLNSTPVESDAKRTSQIASTAVPKTVTEFVSGPDYPDSYECFISWLSDSSNLIEKSWARNFVLPTGALNPDVMIIAALPEQKEQTETGIFSSQSKVLMENMIKAIGSDSRQCYFASLALARSLDGRLDESLRAGLKARILHLIHLVSPRRIIVLGDEASKIFFDQDLLSARKKKQYINHVSSNTEAIATFHPRILLERPQFKADAWKDLQLLLRTVDL